MQIRPGVELAGLSDVGCVRENNEDQYSYWEPASDDEFRRKGRLAIIADGMGGHEGGQDASRIAVETIETVYAQAQGNDPQNSLLAAFAAAHQNILLHASRHPELQGMGTTSTAIALLNRTLYYVHVGDSRLYLLRSGQISCITRDHSYVARMIDEGLIGIVEAAHHPHRNVLLKALGSGKEVTPDSPEQPLLLEKEDVLLLCTDGLWNVVREPEIAAAMAAENLEKACENLVEKAKKLGGPDNITVEILRISR